jgi:hypothetical protein
MGAEIDDILDIFNEVNKIVNEGDQDAELMFIYTSMKKDIHLLGGSFSMPKNTGILVSSDEAFQAANLETKKQIINCRKAIIYLAYCILEADPKAKAIFLNNFKNK